MTSKSSTSSKKMKLSTSTGSFGNDDDDGLGGDFDGDNMYDSGTFAASDEDIGSQSGLTRGSFFQFSVET